ncbi:MAG: radical SAM protein [Bacteroidota bacterium]|nr:radical SAM protein [Bacteroidota bacterium]
MQGKFHNLYLETTRRCNLNCPYCSSGSQRKIDKKDLTFKQIVDRILIPAREKVGSNFLTLSGGEFLVRKDAMDILKISEEMGFRLSIVTNGTLMDERFLDRMEKEINQKPLISLGINSFDDNDQKIREVSLSYTLDLIDRLQNRGIPINISATMGRFNADTFHDTLKQFSEMGLPFNRIPFTPRNTNQRNLMFDKELLKNKLHPALNDLYKGYVSFIPFFLDPEYYKLKTGQSFEDISVPTNPSVGCWVGSFYAVTPDGEVSPCPLLGDHVSGGNVLNEDLSDILFKSELFTKITDRNNLKGKCGKCKYRYTCGGCRVMAYYLTGDVFAEDPTCFIDELSDDELEKLEKQTKANFRKYYMMAKMGGGF